MLPGSTKIKCIKIEECLQWMLMEGLDNHEQLQCTNYDFVHKSAVDLPLG